MFFITFINPDAHDKLTSADYNEQTTHSATPSSTTFTSNGNEEKGTESQRSSNYSMTSAQRETTDSFVST